MLFLSGQGLAQSSIMSLGQIGLIGHWKLDQESLRSATVLADATPYSNHGTSANAAVFTTDRQGQANSAFVFNGSSDVINMGDVNDVNSNSFTMMAWVEIDAIGAIDLIIGKGQSGANPLYSLYTTATGAVGCSVEDVSTNSFDSTDDGTVLTINTWTHVAAVVNRSANTITRYFNGVATGTVDDISSVTGSVASSNNFRIGGWDSGTFKFAGTIDDARLYNRALSAAEILSVATSYRPQLASIDKGLVAHFPLDQESLRSATVFADRTPYSNHGTLTAGTGGFSTDRMGQSNKCYDFDGSTDIITVSDPNILDFGTGDFSISFWVFSDDLATTKYILQKKVSFNNNSAGFTVFISTDNGINARIADGTNVKYLDSNVTVADGEWHSVVLTFDRSANLTVYVDDGVGVSEAIDGAANSISNSDGLWIGQRNGGAAFFNGKLAELKFYNRILSATEITTHANNYKPQLVVTN